MDLTVQQLRYFLAVAEELHFTRAAERLRIAVPSLSQQVAGMDKRLRVSLFRRTSRSVQLTETGRALMPLARRAVEAVYDVDAWAVARRSGGQRLRIGTMVGSGLASAVLSEAAERFPEVSWQVRELGFAGCFDALRADEVDAVLVTEAERPVVSGISAVALSAEQRVLVGAQRGAAVLTMLSMGAGLPRWKPWT